MPKTFAEKKEFVSLIKSWQRNPMEENYAEAVKHAPKCYAAPSLPDNIQELFDSFAMNEPLSSTTSEFRCV
jgi:hypothetical protein